MVKPKCMARATAMVMHTIMTTTIMTLMGITITATDPQASRCLACHKSG